MYKRIIVKESRKLGYWDSFTIMNKYMILSINPHQCQHEWIYNEWFSEIDFCHWYKWKVSFNTNSGEKIFGVDKLFKKIKDTYDVLNKVVQGIYKLIYLRAFIDLFQREFYALSILYKYDTFVNVTLTMNRKNLSQSNEMKKKMLIFVDWNCFHNLVLTLIT